MHPLRALVFCAATLASLPAVEAALSATPSTGRAHRYERIEWQLSGVPAAANPFQPELITVDLEVTAPSGKKLTMPGFAYREVDTVAQRLPSGQPRTTYSPLYQPKGVWLWAVRFCPAESGRYAGRMVVRLAGKETESTSIAFRVADSSAPGFKIGRAHV